MAKTNKENNLEEMEIMQPQTEAEQETYDRIGADFDKMLDGMRAKFTSSDPEVQAELDEVLKELEADKIELQQGVIEGSPQYIKDELFMHQFSIGAGVVMAGVGTFLLIKARKVIGKSKAKIAGWILAGLGVGIVGLHIAQLFGFML